MTKISIQDFLAQAHPYTLDWLEDNLLDGLIKVDQLHKKNIVVHELKKSIAELNDVIKDKNMKSF